MNAKKFSILAIITISVVIAAVMLTQPKTVTTDKKKLFPDLSAILNEVTEINVTTKDETITLTRGEGQWLLKEKHNYPVASDKVNKLLLGAADLTIVEPKTSNPARYSKIGVEEVSFHAAKSVLLSFKKEGKTVASLIVGNDRIAKIDSNRREIYVRQPDEKQAWLTLGLLPIEKTQKRWLDQQIIDLDSNNIRQVSVTHPDGDHFLVFKNTPKDENYQLADLPKDAEIKAAHKLNSIVSTLSRLNLDDVTTGIEFDDSASLHAVFTTFDGLEVTMTTMEKEGKHYAKFVAAFKPEKSETVEPTDDVEAALKAETINAKLKGWVYALSEYKVDNLNQKREELISVAEAPTDETPPLGESSLPPFDVEEGLDFQMPLTETPPAPEE